MMDHPTLQHWRQNTLDVHGLTGEAWLAALPALLAECTARWSIRILPPFADLSYNYVAPAVGPDGAPLVLKTWVPHGELWSEIEALRAFDGRGAVRLVDADPERGVLLLEHVLPGGSLRALNGEDEIIAGLVGVMRRLHRPLPVGHSFRTVADLARGLDRLRAEFDGGYGPFPPDRVDRAAALFRELTATGERLLIHGDLNPGNILRSDRDRWLAIDPKGYAGSPLFDTATFLNDPGDLPEVELRRRVTRRAGLLAEALGVSRGEVLAWAEAHAVLSGWWSYEDHGTGWEQALALAAIYETL